MELSGNGFGRQLADAEQSVISSLKNYCTTGLRGQLDAAEKSVIDSLKNYYQTEIERVIPPLHQRIADLEMLLAAERKRADKAEQEAQRLSETHLEIVELLRELLPSVYERYIELVDETERLW